MDTKPPLFAVPLLQPTATLVAFGLAREFTKQVSAPPGLVGHYMAIYAHGWGGTSKEEIATAHALIEHGHEEAVEAIKEKGVVALARLVGCEWDLSIGAWHWHLDEVVRVEPTPIGFGWSKRNPWLVAENDVMELRERYRRARGSAA